MKRLTYLVAVLLLASFNLQAQWGPILSASVVSSGGGCSPSQGNILADEGFEVPTTGYETSGWGTATGSPDPAYSITGLTSSKPNGSCTQGFRSNYATTGVFNYNYWAAGADQSATGYFRFYLYISSHSIASGESAYIGGVFTNTTISLGNRNVALKLTNNAGQLELRASGGTASNPVNLSTGQWYRVELMVAMNAVSNGSALKVNGGTAQTFTDTGYSSWRTIALGTFSTTYNDYTLNDCVWDLIAADSAGYIGPTP